MQSSRETVMQQKIFRRPCPETLTWGQSLPPILRRLYAARGIDSETQLDYQLAALARPSELRGASAAAEILGDAIVKGQSITVVGDFDADGATSTAVAILGLRMLGASRLSFRVPSRFSDGYGLTPGIIERLQAENAVPDVLVTVDNGIAANEGVAAARAAGCRVVVTDHHLPGDVLPAADAIVNPNQPGCEFLSKNAAGVAVMFYVLTVVRQWLRERGHFRHGGLPPLVELLDLVALGTVADVVPLDHNNRILVSQGIRRIRDGKARPGIMALLEVAGRDYRHLSSTDLGFVVGPRLNAAGRLDDMSLGIACLLADTETHARALAQELDQLNRERRGIESEMKAQAEAMLKDLSLDSAELPWGLCLHEASWHQGVIGILASRIKEKTHRPVIAFADADEQGLQVKGSARSVPGLHIRDVLAAVDARKPGLLLKYGGHAMAAGLTLSKERLGEFSDAFDLAVRAVADEEMLSERIVSDGPLAGPEMTLDTARLLQKAGPWGQLFPEPLFDGAFEVLNQRIVGERHLKLMVRVPDSDQILDGIAFNVDTQRWPRPCDKLQLVYKLDVNVYRGRESVQLLVQQVIALDD
ncbi:MAG: single-stranded-DNA-specific exonuclease RecJ [Alteromonadaceae bacterium]|nr:single-stranded-DNA-specific exonuclease RecJ [Alteromonadaceae bacterium]